MAADHYLCAHVELRWGPLAPAGAGAICTGYFYGQSVIKWAVTICTRFLTVEVSRHLRLSNAPLMTQHTLHLLTPPNSPTKHVSKKLGAGYVSKVVCTSEMRNWIRMLKAPAGRPHAAATLPCRNTQCALGKRVIDSIALPALHTLYCQNCAARNEISSFYIFLPSICTQCTQARYAHL